MLVFDGRLDNWENLRDDLRIGDHDACDSTIVLASFFRWGEHCFSRFIGDWALALWSAETQALYLARDHAGMRTLYFSLSDNILRWSTFLETYFVGGSTPVLEEQYAACYLGMQPIRDLTPYKNIRAVPPAHYLVVRNREVVKKEPHWQWMAKEKLRYKADTDYEDHFFSLFKQAVSRRDGPGALRLAELSGGVDSTSIVCMADHLRRSQNSAAELVDTVSFYDDSEPNWNERPYFSIVERARGRAGIHVDTSAAWTLEPLDPSQGIYFFPGADSSSIDRERKLQRGLRKCDYRVILSGMGGDEVLGGVPTPYPGLANTLVSGNLALFCKQALAWCLATRRPYPHVVFTALKYTVDLYRGAADDRTMVPPWVAPELRRHCTDLAKSSASRRGRLNVPPAAVSNGLAWWYILETLPHLNPSFLTRREYRYPYLDRDLVDFLFRIPREQIVCPGRRRSLMRRALRNIVPVEVLERRRKAFISRAPMLSLQLLEEKIDALLANSPVVANGFIDGVKLHTVYEQTIAGHNPRWSTAILRTFFFNAWLKTPPSGNPDRDTRPVLAPSRAIAHGSG
jgi:asparagine synthase (glutamine-hydrolysing)